MVNNTTTAVEDIEVQVAYSNGKGELVVNLQVPQGTTLIESVMMSGVVEKFPEDDLVTAAKGVFSQRQRDDYQLLANDRVEIYRPLLMDPREARRQRAKKGKLA